MPPTRAIRQLGALVTGATLLLCANAEAEDRVDPAIGKREQLFVEGGLGVGGSKSDGYTDRLEQFGFDPPLDDSQRLSLRIQGALGYMFSQHLGALLRYDTLDGRTYHRDLSGPSGTDRAETFAWNSRAVSLGLRARLPVAHEWISLYGEADVGLGAADSHMTGEQVDDAERFFGLALAGRVGLHAHASRAFGFFVEGGYVYAPVLDNLAGDMHDNGGFSFSTGIRVRTLGQGWW